MFRAIGEDDVQIGEDVAIAGPALEEGEELSFAIPAGSVIRNGSIVADEESLQQAIAGNPVTGDELAAAEVAQMDPHSHQVRSARKGHNAPRVQDVRTPRREAL